MRPQSRLINGKGGSWRSTRATESGERFAPSMRDGFSDSRFKELCELARRHGLAEQVALRLVALMHLKECQLLGRFDAFSHDAQFQAAAHADNGGDDARFAGARSDLPNERLINFQRIDRKFS